MTRQELLESLEANNREMNEWADEKAFAMKEFRDQGKKIEEQRQYILAQLEALENGNQTLTFNEWISEGSKPEEEDEEVQEEVEPIMLSGIKLEHMSVKELKMEAAKLDIKGISKMNRDDLIEKIKEKVEQ